MSVNRDEKRGGNDLEVSFLFFVTCARRLLRKYERRGMDDMGWYGRIPLSPTDWRNCFAYREFFAARGMSLRVQGSHALIRWTVV